MLGLLKTVVKGTIGLSLLAVGSTGGYIAYTKPSEDSFPKFIEQLPTECKTRECVKTTTEFRDWFKQTNPSVAYYDYLFWREAAIIDNNKKFRFVGVCHNWMPYVVAIDKL